MNVPAAIPLPRNSMAVAAPRAGVPCQPTAKAATEADNTVELLLIRMRQGDRQAAADFITACEPRLRRRIRGKLSQPMRRIFDSEEIFSTILRRLDDYVSRGCLAAMNEEELWSLVFRMADNAVVDKLRTFHRFEITEREGAARSHMFAAEDRVSTERSGIEVESAIRTLSDPVDRKIMRLYLDGGDSSQIAKATRLTPAAVRKHLQCIRQHLSSMARMGML